ncbi:unnamed protein product [Cyprideis torosa]|uniref:Uncharacterized protein n=1 Tax=Cyprideis torosa TaxID=163714 RepID=A0A7R8ZSE0_9CRUS|nr:unnamed protein product [Cyprideis torosa]CAG0895324.1 unnamed protein product [Cyprideis torosa]
MSGERCSDPRNDSTISDDSFRNTNQSWSLEEAPLSLPQLVAESKQGRRKKRQSNSSRSALTYRHNHNKPSRRKKKYLSRLKERPCWKSLTTFLDNDYKVMSVADSSDLRESSSLLRKLASTVRQVVEFSSSSLENSLGLLDACQNALCGVKQTTPPRLSVFSLSSNSTPGLAANNEISCQTWKMKSCRKLPLNRKELEVFPLESQRKFEYINDELNRVLNSWPDHCVNGCPKICRAESSANIGGRDSSPSLASRRSKLEDLEADEGNWQTFLKTITGTLDSSIGSLNSGNNPKTGRNRGGLFLKNTEKETASEPFNMEKENRDSSAAFDYQFSQTPADTGPFTSSHGGLDSRPRCQVCEMRNRGCIEGGWRTGPLRTGYEVKYAKQTPYYSFPPVAPSNGNGYYQQDPLPYQPDPLQYQQYAVPLPPLQPNGQYQQPPVPPTMSSIIAQQAATQYQQPPVSPLVSQRPPQYQAPPLASQRAPPLGSQQATSQFPLSPLVTQPPTAQYAPNTYPPQQPQFAPTPGDKRAGMAAPPPPQPSPSYTQSELRVYLHSLYHYYNYIKDLSDRLGTEIPDQHQSSNPTTRPTSDKRVSTGSPARSVLAMMSLMPNESSPAGGQEDVNERSHRNNKEKHFITKVVREYNRVKRRLQNLKPTERDLMFISNIMDRCEEFEEFQSSNRNTNDQSGRWNQPQKQQDRGSDDIFQ